MIQTYCENASGAIIYVSLTGGREGKLISNDPPVSVYIGEFAEWRIQGKEFRIIYDSNGQVVSTPINKEGVIYSGIQVLNEGDNLYFNWIETTQGTFQSISINLSNSISQAGIELFKTSEDYYYQADVLNNITDVMYGADIDGIAIWDESQTIYTRRNYEGLSINYSVQCLNCAKGECAGSNGDGGVICMDCEELSGNINAAIRSYK